MNIYKEKNCQNFWFNCSCIIYGTGVLMELNIVWHCSLTDRRVGSWEEGMSTEATGMFFRALRNLSER